MTVKDLNTLRNDVNTALADNTAGNISAADVRSSVIDSIDSLEAVDGSTVLTTTIGEFIETADQDPNGLGSAGILGVSFGAGGDTTNSEFTVSSAGVITCNAAGANSQYHFNGTFYIGRSGAAGVSVLHLRMMYAADGVPGNAAQLGSTYTTLMDDPDYIFREQLNHIFAMPQGAIFWVEIARDESGNNSGGLTNQPPTATLAGWNSTFTARLRINKNEVA